MQHQIMAHCQPLRFKWVDFLVRQKKHGLFNIIIYFELLFGDWQCFAIRWSSLAYSHYNRRFVNDIGFASYRVFRKECAFSYWRFLVKDPASIGVYCLSWHNWSLRVLSRSLRYEQKTLWSSFLFLVLSQVGHTHAYWIGWWWSPIWSS